MRGGARIGSGAKSKYGEKTKIVSFRLPVSLIPEIKEKIKEYLLHLKDQ